MLRSVACIEIMVDAITRIVGILRDEDEEYRYKETYCEQ
jgi:hypothetical protein